MSHLTAAKHTAIIGTFMRDTSRPLAAGPTAPAVDTSVLDLYHVELESQHLYVWAHSADEARCRAYVQIGRTDLGCSLSVRVTRV